MPRFAANVTMLFTELPFLDRFEAAARAGFEGVECQFPYEHPAAEIADRLRRHGQRLVLHNLPVGNGQGGERGIACIPGREDEFRRGLDAAIGYATALGCPQLNCLAGLTPAGVEPERVHATLAANLRHADERLAAEGIRLLVESVNARDVPGFHLTRTAEVRALIEEGGLRNTFIQYDVYHAQVTEGDIARTLEANLDLIRHVQIADNPGRHEPGTGEIGFPFLFGHLDRIGYDGWIGCEYRPSGPTVDSFAWLPAALGS